MRIIRTALLAGLASLACAGLAQARGPNTDARTHVMTVALPGGGGERILYRGDVPPRIVLVPVQAARVAFMDPFAGPDSPFALLDRISAAMDRQAQMLLREAASLAGQPSMGDGRTVPAGFGALPPGSEGYRFVATVSGDGACMRSVEITATGNGEKPRVVSRSAGDCGPAQGQGDAAPVRALPAPRPAQPLGTLLVRDQVPSGAKPYAGLVRRIAYWQR